MATAPTLTSYAETAWNSTGTAKATSGSLSWANGDFIVALGGCESGGGGVPKFTMQAPTATGLVFAAVTGAESGTSDSYCYANAWTATATAAGTQTVSGHTSPAGSFHWGLGVWAYSGSSGLGNKAVSGATANTAATISLVRGSGDSCVVGGGFDWGAVATTGYAFTPALGTAGHDRQHAQDSNRYSYYVADWGDQGAAGTTSYGITGVTVGVFTKIMLEITGIASVYTPVYTHRMITRQAVGRASLW